MSDDVFKGVRDGMAVARVVKDVFMMGVATLCRPLALLTEAIFRKDMGERYFTRNAAATGLVVLAAATAPFFLTKSPAGASSYAARLAAEAASPENPSWVKWAGFGWIGLFLLASILHQQSVRHRYKSGARWHSGNSGVPRVPILTVPVQYVAIISMAALAYFAGLKLFALLLVLSLLCSAITERIAAVRFWNSVLDMIDAEIESENLGKAVTHRLSPARSEGLETRVPAYVSKEWREKFAKVVGAEQRAQSEPEIVIRNGLMPTGQPDQRQAEPQSA